MNFFKRISEARRRRSDDKFPRLSAHSSTDSGDGASEPVASSLVDRPLVQVRIEPNSAETKAQSLLQARSIEDPIFTIGRRRGFVSRSPEDVDFSIRQVEPYTVSKRHCSIERLEDCVIVHDLGGKYGCLVDDQRIGGKPSAPKSIKLAKGCHDLILGPRNSTVRFKLIID